MKQQYRGLKADRVKEIRTNIEYHHGTTDKVFIADSGSNTMLGHTE